MTTKASRNYPALTGKNVPQVNKGTVCFLASMKTERDVIIHEGGLILEN